jgi:ketol-acid reductoisomerase
MKIKFGDVTENIVMRKEFPLKKAQKVLKGKTVAVLGYGIQGPGQALNMRDNGINVIVGQRKSTKANSSWKRAIKDGWVPGKTLFSIEEAAEKGDIIMMLTSDASIAPVWKQIEKYVTPGKALYFSHGFGYVYNKLTGVKPAKGVAVVMVAPKGSGTSVRRNFLNGQGINSSYAFDANGADEKKTEELTLAIGIAVGSGYLFPTTFQNEVTSDLVGERGILMGALCGVMEAQYNVLRKNGHSPSEAFNETCEELTQSLIRLVDENGMDWMYSNCSQTAQHGALKWREPFRKATAPVFEKLYKSVKNMTEAKEVIRDTGCDDYKEKMAEKLQALHDGEMWRAGEQVRKLRPNEKAKVGADKAAGIQGRRSLKK